MVAVTLRWNGRRGASSSDGASRSGGSDSTVAGFGIGCYLAWGMGPPGVAGNGRLGSSGAILPCRSPGRESFYAEEL
ncbi:hypothetical protein GCM10010331_13370 [Streptomyces xanthochromogenes]|nr:hypothetical protein GCM10010331_13370 [Streptomyces xanthochromogenes]